MSQEIPPDQPQTPPPPPEGQPPPPTPEAPEQPAGPPAPAAAGGPPEVPYPVHFHVQRQEEYRRLLPIVKGLLAIPHWIVLLFLFIGLLFAVAISWFAVLFTGRYPRGIFDFVVGVQRWSMNVTAYTMLLTDAYPPFSLEPKPDYPVHYDVEYPPDGKIARWRPLVHWLLAIPYLIAATVLVYVAFLLVIVAFFAILFTKRFPEGLFNFIVIAFRWQQRGNVYAYWMTEKYPPFEWG
jgi:hypothetical protein